MSNSPRSLGDSDKLGSAIANASLADTLELLERHRWAADVLVRHMSAAARRECEVVVAMCAAAGGDAHDRVRFSAISELVVYPPNQHPLRLDVAPTVLALIAEVRVMDATTFLTLTMSAPTDAYANTYADAARRRTPPKERSAALLSWFRSAPPDALLPRAPLLFDGCDEGYIDVGLTPAHIAAAIGSVGSFTRLGPGSRSSIGESSPDETTFKVPLRHAGPDAGGECELLWGEYSAGVTPLALAKDLVVRTEARKSHIEANPHYGDDEARRRDLAYADIDLDRLRSVVEFLESMPEARS